MREKEADNLTEATGDFTIRILRIADKYGKDRNETMKKVLCCLLSASEISDFNAFEI